MPSEPRVTNDSITIPSRTEFLATVDGFLENKLRELDVDPSIITDIAISASEVVNNAIIHGNKLDPAKSVTITVTCNDKVVRLMVTDQGGGFDPKKTPDPLAEENLLKEVGRGIFIVRSLMDTVDITPTASGLAVTMTKAIG